MNINKKCPNCSIDFVSNTRQRRKFCSSSCAASFNNKNRNRKHKEIECLFCKTSSKVSRSNQKFCSLQCSALHKSKENYNKLIDNKLKVSKDYNPSSAKKFILIEQDCKCSICNMSNTWNDKDIIFVLDHIDGNSTNNSRENLRLVCPNCDSQLDTYKSKNKNGGRHYRRERYKEGKSF